MHLGRFHWMINSIGNEFRIQSIESHFSTLITHLQTLSANPGNQDVANAFKNSLESFRQILEKSEFSTPRPALDSMLISIGANAFLGPGLFSRTIKAIDSNAYSPALAVAALNTLFAQFREFSADITTIDAVFTRLRVEFDDLNCGEGEIGLLLPRDENSSKLEDLAKELKQWHIALSPIAELFDSSAPPLTIRTFSTTDWMIYLAATPPILFGISTCLKGVNSILKDLIQTRSLLSQLTKTTLPAEKIKELEDHADGEVKEKINNFVEKTIKETYKGDDDARKNELRNALTQSMRTIIQKTSSGAKIELRLLPLEEPEKHENSDEGARKSEVAAIKAYEAQVALADQLNREIDLLSVQCDTPINLIEDHTLQSEVH